MIQDIAPYRLDTAYTPRPPRADSLLCLLRGKSVLAAESGGLLRLPRFCELPVPEADCRFLFSLSGRDCFWCPTALSPAGGDYAWHGLRRAMERMPRAEAFAALTACHLAAWYRANRYCGCCGRERVPSTAERALVCPNCGDIVYPRINPAVIVAVTNGERILLTRYAPAHGPTEFYALVAGFCEIGETAEDTVRREVLEEVGLRVRNIRYYASQPWGIDGNLSLGFFAELDGSDAITLERDELSQALWVRREDMPRHCTQNALTWDMMEAFRTGRM